MPPYRGPRAPVARPRRGHFAHLQPTGATAHQFCAAQVYATIRFTLTVWEHYLGRRVRWYFRRRFPQLEVIPRVRSDTAYSRPGYIECGFERGRSRQRRRYPLGENFDVVAHETGHLIQRSVIGHPDHVEGLEQQALEEAFADLAAIVTLLHVRPAVARLLDRTRGNLFSANLLSGIGEMSQTTVARHANNDKKMKTLEWDPEPRAFRYELSLPFTAGGYDAFVDLYESFLVRKRAIPRALAETSMAGRKPLPQIQQLFELTYRARPDKFEAALLQARDAFADIVAHAWRRMSPYDGYPEALAALLAVARERHGAGVARIFRESFAWRGIAPGVSP